MGVCVLKEKKSKQASKGGIRKEMRDSVKGKCGQLWRNSHLAAASNYIPFFTFIGQPQLERKKGKIFEDISSLPFFNRTISLFLVDTQHNEKTAMQ